MTVDGCTQCMNHKPTDGGTKCFRCPACGQTYQMMPGIAGLSWGAVPASALFLMLGGEGHGQMAEVDVMVAAIKYGTCIYEKRQSFWKEVHGDTLSAPAFVDQRILTAEYTGTDGETVVVPDAWLHDLPTAIINSLWPESQDGKEPCRDCKVPTFHLDDDGLCPRCRKKG